LTNITAPVFLTPSQKGGFQAHEISIGQALKGAGYRTGMAGKWHMGINENSHTDYTYFPTHHGFDEAQLISTVGNNNVCKNPNLLQNPNFVNFCFFMRGVGTGIQVFQKPWVTANLPQRMSDAFTSFLNCAHCAHPADASKPFFWYHASMQPHTPLYFSVNANASNHYQSAVQELDTEVGLIMDTIRARAPNTLVFFVSDNGPFLEDFVYENQDETSAGPFKGGKAQTWEGGFRVPGVAWFPGHVAAGSVRDELVTTMDIFPTALRLAGVPLPADRVIDGKDMTNLLFDIYGNGRNDAWHNDAFIYFCGPRLFAARWKKFKMHYVTQNHLTPPTAQNGQTTILPTSPNHCHGECCPLAINSIALCVCQNVYTYLDATGAIVAVPGPWTTEHAVPIIFDLEKDIHEDHPLTPDNFADYYEVYNTINEKVLAFEHTLVGDFPPSQINLPLSNAGLQPLCFGANGVPPNPNLCNISP